MDEHGCKVCRILEEYEMDRYEDQMVEYWHSDKSVRKGYRQLATWINMLLLRREMERAGLSTLGDEAESKYERLTSDGPVAEEVAMDLANEGVPIDQIRRDFVSYGVIRTHLKDCLGENISLPSGEWEREAIEIARNFADEKITEAVSSLHNKDKLWAGGDVTVSVEVDVECEQCHVRIPIEQAVRRQLVCNCGVSAG